MFLISHRGNLNGPEEGKANRPSRINEVLDLGYDCEVDVWKMRDTFYLGHDRPEYVIDIKFLKNPKLWCHAKNLPALENMLSHGGIHCFWHEEDKFTITSKGYIWTSPQKEVTNNSVIVHKDSGWRNVNYHCAGVCTDFIYER